MKGKKLGRGCIQSGDKVVIEIYHLDKTVVKMVTTVENFGETHERLKFTDCSEFALVSVDKGFAGIFEYVQEEDAFTNLEHVNTVNTSVQALLDRCRAVKYPRNIASILRCVTAELGELSEEVDIACGTSYKQPDVDGVIGEAVDVLISVFDLIAVHHPNMRSEEVFEIIDKKMSKWETKTRAHLVQKSLNP